MLPDDTNQSVNSDAFNMCVTYIVFIDSAWNRTPGKPWGKYIYFLFDDINWDDIVDKQTELQFRSFYQQL